MEDSIQEENMPSTKPKTISIKVNFNLARNKAKEFSMKGRRKRHQKVKNTDLPTNTMESGLMTTM